MGKRVPRLSKHNDSWAWTGSPNSSFQVSGLADSLDASWSSLSDIPTLWCTLLPKKIDLFIWRARRSFLPCLLQLATRGISVSSLDCPLCVDSTEDTDHARFRCSHTRRVWMAVTRWWGVSPFFLSDYEDFFFWEISFLAPRAARPIWVAVLYVTLWAIWKEHNQFVMQKKAWNLLEVISDIQVLSHLWISSRCSKFNGSLSTWLLKSGACLLSWNHLNASILWRFYLKLFVLGLLMTYRYSWILIKSIYHPLKRKRKKEYLVATKL